MWTWGLLGAYTLVLLLIGWRGRRRLHDTAEAFFLADRQLSAWVAAGSLLASWFGAASTIATYEDALQHGFSAFGWIGLPTVLTVLILAMAAPWIRSLPTVSTPDLLAMRYGTVYGHFVRGVLVAYMVGLAASQAVALGLLLRDWTGMGYTAGVLCGLAIVVTYAAVGGYLSVVITDWLQWLLILGFLGLLWGIAWPVRTHVAHPVPTSPGELVRSTHLWSTLSFTIAWSISPIGWQRIASVRDPRHVRTMMVIVAGVFLIAYLLVVLPGAWWGGTHPGTHRLGTVLRISLSQPVFALAMLALTAAVMSTLDAALNTGVYMIAALIRIRRRAFGYALATLALAVCTGWIALAHRNIIRALGLSSEILVVTIAVPIVLLRWPKWTHPWGAWACTFVGAGIAAAEYIGGTRLPPALQWPHGIPWGLTLSGICYAVGTWLGRRYHRPAGVDSPTVTQ